MPFLIASHVLGSRAWTPTWKYDPRRTGWRIDVRLRCFCRPRRDQKKPPGSEPLHGTLHLSDARLYRSTIRLAVAIRFELTITHKPVSNFPSLRPTSIIKTSLRPSQLLVRFILIVRDVYNTHKIIVLYILNIFSVQIFLFRDIKYLIFASELEWDY